MKVVQHRTRQLEGTPHPARCRPSPLDLNLANAARVVADDCVEQLRPIDRKSQKGEPVIG